MSYTSCTLLEVLERRKEDLESHIREQKGEQEFKLKQAAWAAQSVVLAEKLLAEIDRAIANVVT